MGYNTNKFELIGNGSDSAATDYILTEATHAHLQAGKSPADNKAGELLITLATIRQHREQLQQSLNPKSP